MSMQPQPKIENTTKPMHWPSLIMVLMSGLSILFFTGGAMTLFVTGLLSVVDPHAGIYDAASSISLGVTGLLFSVLLLPSLVLGIQRLSGRTPSMGKWWQRLAEKVPVWLLVVVYVLLVAVGSLVYSRTPFNWLLMPGINVLAFTLPIIIFLMLGLRALQPFSAQRRWGIFNLGFMFTPVLIIILEIVGMILVFVLLAILFGMGFFPDMQEIIKEFSEMFLSGVPTNPYLLEDQFYELMQQPIILIGVISFIAVFVPIVEELLKPLMVYFSRPRLLTPQEGWALGLLSGAGFTLLESLGNATIGEGWTFISIVRVGTSALHMFNTGLIGYTLVLARKNKRYLRLALVFLGTMLLHGVWNGVTVWHTFSNLDAAAVSELYLSPVYLAVIVLISVGAIAGIVWMNKRLRPVVDETPSVN